VIITEAALNALIGDLPDDGSLPAFPEILAPQPLNASFAHQMPDNLIRSDVESGLAQQSRPFLQRAAAFDEQLPFNNTDCAIFRAWLAYRVKNGWFTKDVLRGRAYETQTLRIVAGSMAFTRSGDDWIVGWQLETADFPPLSETDLGSLLWTWGTTDDVETIHNLLHQYVHVDYPAAVTP